MNTSDRKKYFCVAVALLCVAFAYLYRLDLPFLWGDEADTGIFARNILQYGYPAAFDGRNIPVHNDCSQLSRSLISIKIPWVTYYMGALSIILFGDNTMGVRLIFALAGLLAFFPVYVVLRRRIPYSIILTVLILSSPQVVLFSRNARYYSVLILLYSVLVWHLSRNFNGGRPRVGGVISISFFFILFFHTHPVTAACCSLSILIVSLQNHKKLFMDYFIASGIGLLSWLLLQRVIGPAFTPISALLEIMISDPVRWFGYFILSVKALFLDMDIINSTPVILWVFVLSAGLIKRKKEILNLLKEPVPKFIFISMLVHTIVMAGFFGYETTYKFSFLRYMPHMILWSIILLFFMIRQFIRHDRLFLFCGSFILASNLFTISYWIKPDNRKVPLSWWLPVYSEILRPREDGWHKIISKLRNNTRSEHDNFRTISLLPAWTHETAIYYLGDRYIIIPQISKKGYECAATLRKTLGEESYERFAKRPSWIIDFFRQIDEAGSSYQTLELDCFRDWPDDGVRPELVRHTFSRKDNGSCLIRLHKLAD